MLTYSWQRKKTKNQGSVVCKIYFQQIIHKHGTCTLNSPLQGAVSICELGTTEAFSASRQRRRTLSQTQLTITGACKHAALLVYPEQ